MFINKRILIVTSNHSNGFCRQCTFRRTTTGILYSQGLYVNISVFDRSGKSAVKRFRAERLALLNILGSSPLEKWRTGLAPKQSVSETMKMYFFQKLKDDIAFDNK